MARPILRAPLVLGYHRIGTASGDALVVDPAAFDRQLRLLRRLGLRPAPLQHRGRGTFSVTFDDGFRDGITEALPVLEAHGASATFYVCTGWVGHDDQPAGIPAPDGLGPGPRLTWDDLARLEAAGCTIGSHTVSHRELTRLADDELEHELRGSKAHLEEGLGHEVVDICYPRGKHDARVLAAAASAGYRRGVITPPRRMEHHGPLAIERIGIYGHDTMPRVLAKALRLHRAARRLLPR